MKNQEEIKEVFFSLKNTIFSMAIFEKINFQMKKHKKEIIKNKPFQKKSWRDWFFFVNTKRFPHNEIWTTLFLVAKDIFVDNIVFQNEKWKKGIFQEVQKFKISLKKEFKKLINRKIMKDFFQKKKKPNNRYSEDKFLDG